MTVLETYSQGIDQALPIFTLEEHGIQAVDARTLHAWLEIGTKFTTWFERVTEKYGFVEGEEYFPNLGSGADQAKCGFVPGGNRKDYTLSLDMAKELCMTDDGDKGKLTRRYLIAAEKKARAVGIAPKTVAEVTAIEVAQIQAIRAKALAEIASIALEGNYKDQVLRGAVALAEGKAKEETEQDIIFFEDFLKGKGIPSKYAPKLSYVSTLAHKIYQQEHGHKHEKYPHPFKNIRVIGWQKNELRYLEQAWDEYGQAKLETLLVEREIA